MKSSRAREKLSWGCFMSLVPLGGKRHLLDKLLALHFEGGKSGTSG